MPEEQNPFNKFSPEIQKNVEGLLYLGYLTDEFEFCGHRFAIRTLRGEEELLASLVCKDYMNSLGQAKAWAWAHVGLALTSVDGKEDFCPPIGPDQEEFARARFNYVTKKWFWPLGEYVYERYAQLVKEQAEAIDALRNLSKRSLRPSRPSQGSLNEQGTSPEKGSSDSPS